MARPPKIAEKFLNYIALTDEDFSITGDLAEEYYEMVQEKGALKARIWYYFQICKATPSFLKYSFIWRGVMFKNYFKVAIRNLRRHKGYSFINIAGLAIGMACCLLIMLYVSDELSYDQYHHKADRIYRIGSYSTIGGTTRKFAASPAALAPALSKFLPQVENHVRLFNFGQARFRVKDKNVEVPGLYLADSEFFDIFTYHFITGNSKTALTEPNSVVITQEAAMKLFGTEQCLGKPVNFQGGRNRSIKVTGIIKNIPKQSHFNFNILLSASTFRQNNDNNNQNQARPSFLEEPVGFGTYSYLLLSKGAKPVEVEGKIMSVVESQWGELLKQRGIVRQYPLTNLKDIHLRSHLEGELGSPGDINYIYLFSAIAFFVILIACFNFINLSTARSTLRAKEVGLRKVFGAHRRQLVKQFLSESIILSFLGLVLGVILVIIILPSFNLMAGKEFGIKQLLSFNSILVFLAIIVLTGFVAGSFPAFVLSGFKPVSTIRGKLDTVIKNTGMRKVLVVIQFSISIFLIVSIFVILKQLDYIKNKDLGFNREQLVVLPFRFPPRPQNNNTDRDAMARLNMQRNNTLKTRLKQNPNILSSSLSISIPGQQGADSIFIPEGKTKDDTVRTSAFRTDMDFIKTYGMKIKWGRDFSPEFSTDEAEGIILNLSASKAAGWGADAIGKKMFESDTDTTKRVIGVIEDFHHKNLKMAINPTTIEINRQFFRFLSVRISPHNISSTLDFLKNILTNTNPQWEFSYFFIDDDFRNKYPNEEIVQSLYFYFGILAVFVACLGLFGLATFIIDRRNKEIGIRKILGASVQTIAVSLSREFVKWVLLANLIAWPAAYYIMGEWLGNFAYRTNISLDIFLLSGVIAVLIALVTVSYQSIKAATRNPVDTLRGE
jgi:putative ABC transport system permease protein